MNSNNFSNTGTTQKIPNNSIPPSFITLTPNDIDNLCKICDISWTKYFSKPLPGYDGMKVYWKGEIQLFHQLKREDQIEIIKSAHISNITDRDIRMQRQSTHKDFIKFINEFIGFNEGHLLGNHGIAHHIRTAILAQISAQQYFKNFNEYENMSSRTLFCSLSASLLHDIGRCFGGDMYDVFGPLSAEIAGQILNEVGGFSDEEIEWIKEAIDVGGLSKDDAKTFSIKNDNKLNSRQIIACLMGDADSYEFERFRDILCCDIAYTSVKKLGLFTREGESPDSILNQLKNDAQTLCEKIQEPETNTEKVDFAEILRDELTKLNTCTPK